MTVTIAIVIGMRIELSPISDAERTPSVEALLALNDLLLHRVSSREETV